MVFELTIAIVVGIVIGGVGVFIFLKRKPSETMGCINIDRSDPDGPYLFLELSGSISELSGKDYAKFKVKNKDYISPK